MFFDDVPKNINLKKAVKMTVLNASGLSMWRFVAFFVIPLKGCFRPCYEEIVIQCGDYLLRKIVTSFIIGW